MCSHVLLREHADTCPRGGQQLVLLLYFSWPDAPNPTFLARNQMGTLISITLLDISLQVSGRGFSWIKNLVLPALERELVPRARREDRAEVGSCGALLWVGGGAPAGESGRADNIWAVSGSDEQERWDLALNPHPASCRRALCGATVPWPHQSPIKVWARGCPVFGGFPVLFLSVQGLPCNLIPNLTGIQSFIFSLPYFRIWEREVN